ncbi:unnamed protein product [Phytophthora lilii]|uniref:Unnamed protein product n=1 Tax=Phytophthora lilii TaxID=2077276 RepID=A0A9W7CJK2_9STRA|nr:unnamed protein product [Phytophthora lilii]
MSDTSAFMVAQGFEEYVYRRFGAPSLIRHDRDPRFMSEVFQAFAENDAVKVQGYPELSATSQWATKRGR